MLEHKLEAIGSGFLVPVFFIATGVAFDLRALTSDAAALAQVPIFLAALLVVRGAPALLLHRHELAARDRVALALYSSTTLPLVVAITTIAVAGGHMRSATAAALVAAGMLSVLLFPIAAVAARPGRLGTRRQVVQPAPSAVAQYSRRPDPELRAFRP